MKPSTCIATAALLAGLTPLAQAAVINFDSHTPLYDFSSPTILDSGFSFTIGNRSAQNFIGVSDINPNPPGAFNGTAYLHFSDFSDGETMTLQRVGGGAFTLDSFDLGLSWFVGDADINSTLITISGDLAAGGSFSSSTTANRSFATQILGQTITALRVSMDLQTDGYLSLDNFSVQLPPRVLAAPGSWALVGLALAGLALMRRRAA
jgi:hypothetical protein